MERRGYFKSSELLRALEMSPPHYHFAKSPGDELFCQGHLQGHLESEHSPQSPLRFVRPTPWLPEEGVGLWLECRVLVRCLSPVTLAMTLDPMERPPSGSWRCDERAGRTS